MTQQRAVAGRDRVVPLAVSGLAPWRLAVGRRLPEPLANYLVDRARHGPWIEYLDETEASSYAGGPLPDHVVLATAPMFAGDDLIGLSPGAARVVLDQAIDEDARFVTAPPADFVVDTSNQTVGETAEAILAAAELVKRPVN